MSKTYKIELNELDLGQVLDALEMRAETWERTAEYHRNPSDSWQVTGGSGGLVEECSGVAEAERMAASYRAIMGTIKGQLLRQAGRAER
jgi:hypothetical protein